MTSHAHGATDGAVVADARGAGDAGAGGHGGVLANAAVVTDLDQVVDLGPGGDDGILEGAAIDAAIGADLDVIADLDAAELGHAEPAPAIPGEAETIAADDAARLEQGATPDAHLGAEGDPRHQARLGPHPAPGADDGARADEGPGADLGLGLHHRAGPDPGAGVHPGAGIDHGAGVATLGRRGRGVKQPAGVGIGQVGVGADQGRHRAQGLIRRGEDDGAGLGPGQGVTVFLVGVEAEVPGPGRRQGGDPADAGGGVPRQGQPEAPGEFAEGVFQGPGPPGLGWVGRGSGCRGRPTWPGAWPASVPPPRRRCRCVR